MSSSLVPDAGLRTEAGGRVLIGGHPFRVIRLSAGGSRQVRSWFRGDADARGEAETELMTRLIDAAMAHPRPRPAALEFHVVIPFRGPVEELRDTVDAVRNASPASITVVDDGSEPAVPALDNVTVLRHDTARGPGAARNTGWRHVADTRAPSGVVVFLDGGVISPAGRGDDGSTWLEQLGGHLTEPQVAAVAPRVSSMPGCAAIERYESQFSPLDLGPAHSIVGPGRLVAYVPSACLLVRIDALQAVDGFDESLRYGEDVDLVWRLSEEHEVRYDPSVAVHHGPRRSVRAFAEQRYRYATAAAALDQRHPSASAPWKSSLVGVAGVALLSIGKPAAAAVVGLAPLTLLADRLENTATPMATSARLLFAGHRWALMSFAEGTCRTWCSVAIVAAAVPPLRSASVGWMVAGWMRRLSTTRSPQLLALGIVDDVSYGVGCIAGAARHRSIRSLLPSISRWG